MAETEELTLRCAECGKEIRVPKGLDEFSCVYCGAKLTLARCAAPPASPAGGEAACASCAAELIRCVSEHRDVGDDFAAETYGPKMDAYTAECAPILERLSAAVPPSGICGAMRDAAVRFMDGLEALWADSGSRRARSDALLRDKFTISIFMIPMIRALRLPVSEELAQDIRLEWIKRYPKSPFYLADRETIEGGFRKKFSLLRTLFGKSL